MTIEAEYTVGEYDIVILSAEESSGLETWLQQNGYKLPPGASRALASYIKQNMRFFVAKVNLEEQSKLGFSYLRPLQIAYESPQVHAADPPRHRQRRRSPGSASSTPSPATDGSRPPTTGPSSFPPEWTLPDFVKDEFADFYKAMFRSRCGGRT